VQSAVLAGSLAFTVYYWLGLRQVIRQAPRAAALICSAWTVAFIASVSGFYLFSPNRHNLYFLPFFAIPLAFLLAPRLRLLLASRHATVGVACACLLVTAAEEKLVWFDEDFCLRRADYDAAQVYLSEQLAPGDGVVTGPMGAYFYLIYAKDGGKTPYDAYGDVPYINGTTLLAPFASPSRPYHSWEPFRDELARRLKDGTVSLQANVWFVQMGWKNQEIWTLLHCPAARQWMEHFMSRDGIAIFSMRASVLSAFLSDEEAWRQCYKEYKPLVVGTPFPRMTQP